MNRSRRGVSLTNSYIAYRPRLYLQDEKDLQTRFLESHYNRIVSDPKHYFERVKITNFDLINHDCRGDELEHDRRYYETLFNRKIDDELINRLHTDLFVSAAERSEREDVRFMQKRKKCTDHCKTLPF